MTARNVFDDNTYPGLKPDDPFDEGLSLAALMTPNVFALIPTQTAAMRPLAPRRR